MKNQTTISFWHPASLLCTVFGVGKIPFAPGTWGSLVGVVFFVIFPDLALFALVPLFFIGAAAANHYGQISGKDDASEIVVDEVVGQWVALIVSIYFIYGINQPIFDFEVSGFAISVTFIGVNCILSFLTFRFFDIVKPFPIGWCDRNIKGGFGVMFDDVVAGIFAGITSALIFLGISVIA